MNAREAAFWANARHILHFIGICGAGKTTLSRRLVERCRAHGGRAASTIDWDPHLPDGECLRERAFRRDLDIALIANPMDKGVHRQIVAHSLDVVDGWRQSNFNLAVVDRFVESYDHLPAEAVLEIQNAMVASGYTVTNILLVVGGLTVDQPSAILPRMLHTQAHRPADWWNSGPATADKWAEEEARCQISYRAYCWESPFETIIVDTTMMYWDWYEGQIARQFFAPSSIHRLEGWSLPRRANRSGMHRPGLDWFGTIPPWAAPHTDTR